MLETVDLDQRRQLIEQVPCRVQLPPGLERLLEDEGYATAFTNEFRAGMRYNCCRRVALQLYNDLPAFPRPTSLVGAIVRDFSRRGMGLLFHEQLFPDERVRVLLPSVSIDGIVVRCRYSGPECFELGLALDRECRLRELLA
jgi:hypothetical protein